MDRRVWQKLVAFALIYLALPVSAQSSFAQCGFVCSNASDYRGEWGVGPGNGTADSSYLWANLTESEFTLTSVTFELGIQFDGNYSILLFTPGCIQDNSCATRGLANVTLSTGTTRTGYQTIAQTNNYNKYEQIYVGELNQNSSTPPSVIMFPVSGQQASGHLTFVAQKVSAALLDVATPSRTTSTALSTSTQTTTTASATSSAAQSTATTGDLSTSAKAGIGVGVAVAVILLLILVYMLGRRQRNHKREVPETKTQDFEKPQIAEAEASVRPRRELPTPFNTSEMQSEHGRSQLNDERAVVELPESKKAHPESQVEDATN